MYTTQHTNRSHLSQESRAVIASLHKQGATIREIATIIAKHYSTVSRELHRNCYANGVYVAQKAQKLCVLRRRSAKRSTRKIENDRALKHTLK